MSKHRIIPILALLLLMACRKNVSVSEYTGIEACIYPDYKDVTVPCNIAPLNFHVLEPQGDIAVKIGCGADTITVFANDGDVDIPVDKWRELLTTHAGDTLQVLVCGKDNGIWRACAPFGMAVSADTIDPVLIYRQIPPLYGTWLEMGLYQRDLRSFSEKAIYENKAYHGNCVNCHSLCSRDPGQYLFHLRTDGGGTYLNAAGRRLRLDTKTDSTISNFTYPYWHPSGRYVAFSVNDIFQVFHTSDPNRIEVIDQASDVVVYDIATNQVLMSPGLMQPGILETFPAFSPDGRTLYFCAATAPDSLPEQYRQVMYNLCSVSFDPETRSFGSEVDTLYCAGDNGKSLSFPRPSPDGKTLVATLSGYGNFSIWHKDADLYILDLHSRQWQPMTAANSDDVESYHSWSTNSRWLVFSSRRDDGLYTRPYFTHISSDGKVSKAFMLPQRHPKKFYADQGNSYNIPELSRGQLRLTTGEVVQWIDQPQQRVQPSR